MYSEYSIIKDIKALTEEFIPRRIIHRTGELHALRDNVKPLVDRETPRNSFVYGPPGTGKTCLTRFLASELKENATIYSCYINCWFYPSRFRILYTLLEAAGHRFIHRQGTPTDELLDMLRKKAAERPYLIILDEVDQMEDEKILYDLTTIPNICLILIANSGTVFYDTDPRIRSRLQSMERIGFMAYNEREVAEILKDRAAIGLVPDAITALQINRISAASNGDARAALGILRLAAESAEKAGAKSIEDGHIDSAVPKHTPKHDQSFISLNDKQQTILKIIKDAGEIASSDLYKKIKGVDGQIAERTIRKYLDILEKIGFISSSGEGRWTVYKAVG